jgi:hypothetical protein
MRKLLIAVAAVVALGVFAAVAWADNIYELTLADTASGKGSQNRPIASAFEFGFTSKNADETRRPEVIEGFRIGVEGGVFFVNSRPQCTFQQANDPNATRPEDLPRACRRAIIGSGTIDNEIGATNSPNERSNCKVVMTLINGSKSRRGGDPRHPETVPQMRRVGGLLIRIDTDPPDCIASVHEALVAPFYVTRIGGVRAFELRFSVPDPLRHPGGVLSLAITEVTALIDKKLGTARINGVRRRVGYFSLVGRKGRTRILRVVFEEEESGVNRTETRTFR